MDVWWGLPVLSIDKKEEERPHWVSPHAGQVFCALAILAPHSTQYFVGALSLVMPTELSIDIECESRFQYINTISSR
jgi:hypothetical protein